MNEINKLLAVGRKGKETRIGCRYLWNGEEGLGDRTVMWSHLVWLESRVQRATRMKRL